MKLSEKYNKMNLQLISADNSPVIRDVWQFLHGSYSIVLSKLKSYRLHTIKPCSDEQASVSL